MQFDLSKPTKHSVRTVQFAIVFAWVVGVIVGVLLVNRSSVSDHFAFGLDNLLRAKPLRTCIMILLPLIISAVCIRFCFFKVLVFLIFLKAVSFAAALFWVHCTFGRAGWLACLLLVFTETFSVVAYLWFVLTNVLYRPRVTQKHLALVIILTLVLVLFDYCFVMPLIEEIISRL